MSGIRLESIYSALGLENDFPQQAAILRQRFVSIKKQFPWVYGIFIINLLALNFSAVPANYEGFNPTIVFLMVIAIRLVHWLRMGDKSLSINKLQKELLKSCVVAALVCGAFFCWIVFLYSEFASLHPASVIIFASLTAVGAYYGLSSLPAAAKTPIYFLNLPLAMVLLTSGDVDHIAIGFAQSFLILLMLRMLGIQEEAFVSLVSTRFEIDDRRQSAEASKQLALEGQQRFSEMAFTDPLTGLRNRRGLLAALRAGDLSTKPWGLMILDLDGFKQVNDTFGHAVGDKLLMEAGKRLSSIIEPHECAARLGGDEFAIVCHSATAPEATSLAARVVKALSEPFTIGDRRVAISSCAGVTWRVSGEPLADPMREADIALYSAKKQGRGIVKDFSFEMQDEVQRRTRIEEALRQPEVIEAIDVAYQPIFNLDPLELRAFEALARWEHSELGWISPSEFIPLTEQNSIIEQVSESLLRQAAKAALGWPASVKLSFNLSPIQLSTVGAAKRILILIAGVGLPAHRLQVEVTETALLGDFDTARANLDVLRRAGASVVLDDFGAGYASIGYLRELNFDAIKLDGSLVKSITDVGPALPLLRGVLALCHAMGRQCIAEHIETDAQLRILRQLGCRYGQGFGLARPMSAESALVLAAPKVLQISSLIAEEHQACPRTHDRRPGD